ncbi:amino acid permease [Virgibacillus sp. NKC19-3]|uniref:APC family permease n=1 Tax=Virgibacillus saliphilus TaxID=2831674 RepID=UPI001C9AD66A|nr:APC family permease [Virgibacillus sp. NKC19-3]MBY7144512.1 amino acid permease [Virgibacillus sp. NKC19-3]
MSTKNNIPNNSDNKFERVLSRTEVFFLAIGSMVGWTWGVLSGEWILSAGSLGSVIAFAIGSILIIFVGLAYAELASAMPKVGGEIVYVHRAMGYKLSFIVAWMLVLGYLSVVAFEAVALPNVVNYIVPNFDLGYLWTIAGWDVYLSWVIVGVFGAIVITFINYIGIRLAVIVQVVFSAAILGVGILLIFGSAINGDPGKLQPLVVDGFSGITAVMVMVPFLFVGFDVIPQVAEEINMPFKKIGKIMMTAIVIVVLFYMCIAVGVSLALDHNALISSELVSADAMTALFGSDIFGYILIVGGLAGIITSWNALVIGATRVLYTMAQSGMIPSWFGKLHPKYKTPSNAILFTGVVGIISPFFGDPVLNWAVNSGGLAIVIAFLLVSISFIILRKKEPHMERPYKAGNSNFVGWLASIFSIFFIILYLPGMPSALSWPAEWIIILGWFLIGLYFLLRLDSNKQHINNS